MEEIKSYKELKTGDYILAVKKEEGLIRWLGHIDILEDNCVWETDWALFEDAFTKFGKTDCRIKGQTIEILNTILIQWTHYKLNKEEVENLKQEIAVHVL